jgi:hypothetical protein
MIEHTTLPSGQALFAALFWQGQFFYSQLQDDMDRFKKTASMVTWLVTTFLFL